jgi:hypothetical protein
VPKPGRRRSGVFGVPEGLLHAIGLVRSGCAGPAEAAPWPWAIDADGQSILAADRSAAIEAVAARRAAGEAPIDVGCSKVSLLYHPDAFESLERACDRDANAAAAPRWRMRRQQQQCQPAPVPSRDGAANHEHAALSEVAEGTKSGGTRFGSR